MPNADMPLAVFEEWCEFCVEQNEYVPEEAPEAPPRPPRPPSASGPTAWEDFNHRGTIEEAGLTDAGWVVARRVGSGVMLRRPGKEGHGISAAFGCRKSSERGWPLFHNFSTSVAEFDTERSYCLSYVYAVLCHGGDLAAAAKALAGKGYGSEQFDFVAGPTATIEHGPEVGQPGEAKAEPPADDGIVPDFDFATNADLELLGLEIKWAWQDWLQFGAVNLFSADGGLGKTRATADLVRRVHIEGVWPDGKPVPKWDSKYLAMWVAADQNHAELVSLSKAFGFADRICYSGSKANPLGNTTLDTIPDFTALHARVKAANPMFLIVDTSGGATSKNLAKPEDARSFFTPLSMIAARRQICVIVITHLNAAGKTLGRRAEERCRTVMRMTAESKEPDVQRRLEIVKSNSLFPKPLGMYLKGDRCEYDFSPPPKPEDRPTSGGFGGGGKEDKPPSQAERCKAWLFELIGKAPQRVCDARKMAENAGFSSKTLYNAKDELEIEEVTVQGYKWWRFRVEDQNSD